MLEELINIKTAIKNKKPKSVVYEKFQKYLDAYDNSEKSVADKIRHRDIFYIYIKYMGEPKK